MNFHLKIWISAARLVGGLGFLAVFSFLAGCSTIWMGKPGDPADYLEQVRNDPARLHAFVQEMPKGGDLHTHLSGVPYAESFLKWAAEDGMCISTKTWAITSAPCVDGSRLVNDVVADARLYDQAIDGLSMRDFPLASPAFGHDHFFKAFALFGTVSDNHKGEMLAEAARRAATDNTDYLELMITLQSDPLAEAAAKVAWTGDMETDYRNLLAGMQGPVANGAAEVDTLFAEERQLLSCDGATPEPACRVTIRFVQQGIRTSSHQKVFASLILGSELAKHDPRVVGVDLVAPEDAAPALANYDLHMQMLAFLKKKYPTLKISLHAGEITANFVEPQHLTSHINKAVKVAGAQRIGHGVDLRNENGWQDLLAVMARERIGVAILVTSNAQILGVSGEDHPFRSYLDAGVPVMLASDDQGLSRGSHSAEFERAITTYGLQWGQVKQLIRNSMDQAFIHGKGLWRIPGDYSRVVDACAPDLHSEDEVSPECDAFLRTNAKAAEQWRLERRLADFEDRQWQ
jgi:adenosine deaminase